MGCRCFLCDRMAARDALSAVDGNLVCGECKPRYPRLRTEDDRPVPGPRQQELQPQRPGDGTELVLLFVLVLAFVVLAMWLWTQWR